MPLLRPWLRSRLLLSLLIVGIALVFCEGGCGTTDTEGYGSLSVGLTDAATDEYEGVYVTIEEVRVHPEDGPWETVAFPGETYNLLELANGVIERLGSSMVPAGDYTQMRLVLADSVDQNPSGYANYVVPRDGREIELKVPSGQQTGIKLVRPFTVSANGTTELILDFDATRSVVRPGDGENGPWLLKPTIRILNAANMVTVSGWIASTNSSDMNGTLVSAQGWDPDAENITQRIRFRGSTVARTGNSSAVNATYTLLTEQGEHNLVAFKDGFLPQVRNVVLTGGEWLSRDFTLQNATAGAINGTVNVDVVPPFLEGKHVALSFRHQLQHAGNSTETPWIEITNLRRSPDESDGNFSFSFSATLPDLTDVNDKTETAPGEYRVVASLFGDDSEGGDPELLDEQVENATVGDVLDFELDD